MNRQFFFIAGVILLVVLLTTLILKNYRPAQSMEAFSERKTFIVRNGIYTQLGRAYASRASGDYDSCERLLRYILESDRKNVYALGMLADLFFSQKRYAEAAGVYAELAAIAPNTAAALSNYAIALAMQKKFSAAREQLARALQIEPDSIQLHWQMAAVEASLGNRNAADAHLNFIRNASKEGAPGMELPYFQALQSLTDSPHRAEAAP